jgi:acyl-CoA thioesterase II
MQAHSLHAYFMRAGDTKKPIAYTVDCIRDGKSSTTRRVVATVSQEGLVCHRTREDNH